MLRINREGGGGVERSSQDYGHHGIRGNRDSLNGTHHLFLEKF